MALRLRTEDLSGTIEVKETFISCIIPNCFAPTNNMQHKAQRATASLQFKQSDHKYCMFLPEYQVCNVSLGDYEYTLRSKHLNVSLACQALKSGGHTEEQITLNYCGQGMCVCRTESMLSLETRWLRGLTCLPVLLATPYRSTLKRSTNAINQLNTKQH